MPEESPDYERLQAAHELPNHDDSRFTVEYSDTAQILYLDGLPRYGVELPPAEKTLSQSELYTAYLDSLAETERITGLMAAELAELRGEGNTGED